MVLSMKTTGYLRENLLWTNVREARSPLSQWSALWYDERTWAVNQESCSLRSQTGPSLHLGWGSQLWTRMHRPSLVLSQKSRNYSPRSWWDFNSLSGWHLETRVSPLQTDSYSKVLKIFAKRSLFGRERCWTSNRT